MVSLQLSVCQEAGRRGEKGTGATYGPLSVTYPEIKKSWVASGQTHVLPVEGSV